MPNIRKIFRYMKHYGLKSTFGLIREKLFIDPKRFSVNKERTLPEFPKEYKKASFPLNNQSIEEILNSKPLSIMYLIHYFYPLKKGGTERFTLNLTKEQKKMGNVPFVLVLEANEPESLYSHRIGRILYRYYEYDGLTCIGFRHVKAPLGLYYKSVNLDDEEMRSFARHIIKAHQIDIVHATYPQPFASFLAECKSIDVPYIVTCTDFCMMCHYSTMVDSNGDFCGSSENATKCSKVCKTYGCRDFSKRKSNAEQILASAEIVTVPSEFVARVMSKEFSEIGFLPVAHGISDAFKFSKRNGKIKKFVYAGTLTSLKGVHMLVDAFTSIKNEDLTLDIYGDGDETYVNKLRAAADERIKFHGAVPGDKMPEIYSAADCVIVPSMWYETYNFVLREALLTGAFVISANIGAMPEAVDEGKNGYLFTPSDQSSLREAMTSALNFDFTNYKLRRSPTIREEAEIYLVIYHGACQK